MARSMASMMAAMAIVWVVLAAAASPVKRSPDLEARRRSTIDRSMVRFGRSYPAELSAADIRDAYQRLARRGNSFLRLGKSDLSDEIPQVNPDYDYEDWTKRAANFIRLGRDPKFIRLGRSPEDEKVNASEKSSYLIVNGYPQRMSRARDHFLRLGRSGEDPSLNEEVVGDRRKRSEGVCEECATQP